MPKFEIEIFNGDNNFSMRRIKTKALLLHQGLSYAICWEGLAAINDQNKAREIQLKAHSAIVLSLGDEILREVAEEETTIEVWKKTSITFFEKIFGKLINLLKATLYIIYGRLKGFEETHG